MHPPDLYIQYSIIAVQEGQQQQQQRLITRAVVRHKDSEE
jgi:hypothetical protein